MSTTEDGEQLSVLVDPGRSIFDELGTSTYRLEDVLAGIFSDKFQEPPSYGHSEIVTV